MVDKLDDMGVVGVLVELAFDREDTISGGDTGLLCASSGVGE